ncbi:MAG TPA: Hsp20/alpha crystallin family protein [Gemmataceae bacterium]|nr:Hsp20/alpha crystallin family protein [Gemmataceae bacterium]
MSKLMSMREPTWMEEARKEFDDVFQRLFRHHLAPNGEGAALAWSPRVDVSETDKEFVVKADLPGVDPKDVDISIRDSVLTVKGEKKTEKEEKKENFHRVERFQGSFYREIPMPSGVDESSISATTAKGVVTVTIPKKPEAQPKKIPLKAGE